MDLVNLLGWKEVLLRLGIAVLIGALVGLNRDLHGKPAGLRTNALVCLGAALLVLAGVAAGLDHGKRVDPGSASRVMQGIVTGIGFLGAGVIIHDATGAKVYGLTTAAAIWLSAAFGILCGEGMWIMAGLGAALTLLVLALGGPLERFVHRKFPGLTDTDREPPK